jgi:hypothetical protein
VHVHPFALGRFYSKHMQTKGKWGDVHLGGWVHGSGRLNARTMKAAIAWRLTAVSGQ